MDRHATFVLGLVLGVISVLATAPSWGAEAYKIGMSAAITGPAAGTYAPTFDAYKAYFKRVNDAGGLNGHPVEIAYEDDRGEPSRAAANAKKFGEGVIAIVIASISPTYKPFMTEAEAGKIPLIFGGGVCPKEAFPPANPLVFCSTSFGAQWDSRFAIPFIKREAGGKRVKVGFVAQNIPISQSEMEFAEKLAAEQGLETIPAVVVPGGAADFTPFASRLKDAGADWVLSWAPWPLEIGVFEALKRVGWTGNYLLYAHQQAQDDLLRLKSPNLYAFGGNAMFTENLPIHRQITDAVKGLTAHAPHYMAEGWVSAMVLEQALLRCGWPCSKDKLAQTLTMVTVDTRGLRGGPIEWTGDNHYRKTTFYKVYRWDGGRHAIVPTGDWTGLTVK
ncbi:MAG TPA: ABC transporter substrate-binding protein [Methylomirabilota bacterium]|jgi:ABC-type branched-subunit amino acid transport system substrate-binding protein|nr:ABC transporter substrate-binding protein [Methylomirabilota bacterium]